MVHGFTQNGACMRPFGEIVQRSLGSRGSAPSVTLVDAPGHGGSGHDRADLIDAARLCVEAAGSAHYVGYSMGGRMLLHGALLFPEAFESLTLLGATAGIDDPIERAARAMADDQLAEQLESDGLERFLDAWLELPLFAGLSEAAACRTERLTNRSDGLAASLRNCGTGNQFPLWGHLAAIEVPVLVIAGSADAKFTAIGHRLVAGLPDARFEAIDGGHAVHSEQPEATARAIASFIEDVEHRSPVTGAPRPDAE